MISDINDPRYIDDVRERLKESFGEAALQNAKRALMEDDRIKTLIPNGIGFVMKEPDSVDINFFRYMAISYTFENMADPAPPNGKRAKLAFMAIFVKDTDRMQTDKKSLQIAMQAMADGVEKLIFGHYDNALN